jgi:hypothetical protein
MRSLTQHRGLTKLGDAAEPFMGPDRKPGAWRILLVARAVGGVNRLTRDQIDALERMRGNPSHGQIDHGY